MIQHRNKSLPSVNFSPHIPFTYTHIHTHTHTHTHIHIHPSLALFNPSALQMMAGVFLVVPLYVHLPMFMLHVYSNHITEVGIIFFTPSLAWFLLFTTTTTLLCVQFIFVLFFYCFIYIPVLFLPINIVEYICGKKYIKMHLQATLIFFSLQMTFFFICVQ